MKTILLLFFYSYVGANCHNMQSAQTSSSLVISNYYKSDKILIATINKHEKLLKKEIEFINEQEKNINFRNANDIESFLELKETTQLIKQLFDIY